MDEYCAPMNEKSQSTATHTTRKLQVAIGLSSVVFTIGTSLQNFTIIDISLVEKMMRMENVADPAGAAPITMWFRVVGCLYILGNAVGILALRSRSRLLWWTVFVVNIIQAFGFVMIPSSMWSAATDAYGFWGILPSTITDGGAIILVLVMIISMVKYRTLGLSAVRHNSELSCSSGSDSLRVIRLSERNRLVRSDSTRPPLSMARRNSALCLPPASGARGTVLRRLSC